MTKTDKMIFWITLLAACVMLMFSNVFLSLGQNQEIVIELDGKTYAQYSQASLEKAQVLDIQTEYGYNKIEISPDGVRILESDCSDTQCMGEIRKAGEMLICLPHRLIVRIQGSKGADGIAY